MADVDFRFYTVPNRYQDLVQRVAVLYPLRGPATNVDMILDQTADTVNQWRARITALTDVGWQPRTTDASSRYSILYARNCKPTFAMSWHMTRACLHKAVCPFCYARWVRGVWLDMDHNFPAPEPEQDPIAELEHEMGRSLRVISIDEQLDPDAPTRRDTTFRFHLIERHHYFSRPVLPVDEPNVTLAKNLSDMLKRIQESRATVVNMVDPVGAFMYTTIEPWNDGREWRVHHRQLFKVLPTQQLPAELVAQTAGRIVRHERPSRKEVLQVVGRICRYPLGMMVGNPTLTVQLLTVRKMVNFRAYARFRSFRNKTDLG